MCTQSFEGYRDWDKKKTLNPMGLGMGMKIINGDENEDGESKILLKSDPLSSLNMSKITKDPLNK